MLICSLFIVCGRGKGETVYSLSIYFSGLCTREGIVTFFLPKYDLMREFLICVSEPSAVVGEDF